MKQRFSSLDVKVIAHELSETLVNLRLANIYDLSSKILLFKFAKPDIKRQLLVDSGFRCHLTEFTRTTAAAPSPFVARLRKFLRTRRCTSIQQIGTDRIIEIQFGDGGLYRLYFEYFASGNVILTDRELKIIALMRNVSEGEGQEPQRVGLTYSLEKRQNYGGVPPLTIDRLRSALRTTVTKAATQAAAKKGKTKAGEELRKGLATTIVELPPILIDHALAVTSFDVQRKPAEILESEALLESLLKSLEVARKIVDEVTSAPTSKGYIFATKQAQQEEADATNGELLNGSKDALLYDDFHPFLPQKYIDNPKFKVISFDGFNKTVDEFYSSIEGHKLASRLGEREAAARRKLEAAREDQAKRIGGLQEAQSLNSRKAAAIEANVERVQEAIDAVNGLIEQGMDWHHIEKLIEREKIRGNPVAEIFKLPLRIAENTVTLLLGEEEFEDEATERDDNTDDESDAEDDGASAVGKTRSAATDGRLAIDINLSITPWQNAREYHDQKRQAAAKELKTEQQTDIALRNAEKKIAVDLKRGLKGEKPVLQPLRRHMWFEKFLWFVSSDGYLVLGGANLQQNELLYRRHLRKGDIYVHADLHGAASIVIKNNPKTPDAPIPPSTLAQAGSLSVCTSTAWDSKAGMAAWWVGADQVSKSAPSGEFLPTGSFMIRGKKTFLPPSPLLLGFGLMFRVSEESKAKHVKHRLYDDEEAPVKPKNTAVAAAAAPAQDDAADPAPEEANDDDTSLDEEDQDDGDVQEEDGRSYSRANPLQSTAGQSIEPLEDSDNDDEPKANLKDSVAGLKDTEDPQPSIDVRAHQEQEGADFGEEIDDDDAEQQDDTSRVKHSQIAPSTTTNAQKKGPPKRGQRGKAKKIAAKYADQDEEDRALRAALTGAAAGQAKREAELKAKAQREADLAAQAERRAAQKARQQRQAAEQEEIRKVMLAEGVDVLDEDEEGKMSELDALVGTPLPGDEILEAIPVCAPWSAMTRIKYKAKMQPGAVKKGKAVREIVERWKIDSGKKGVLDNEARDTERMWPREVELIKGLRVEELINEVPVARVNVMTGGGADGQKGGKAGKGGSKRR